MGPGWWWREPVSSDNVMGVSGLGGWRGESGSDQGFSCRIGLNGGNCPALVGVETCNTLRGAFLGSLKSSGVLVLASGRRMREVWTGPER